MERVNVYAILPWIFWLPLIAAPACADQSRGSSPQAIVGHWVYASGESEGSTTAVYGDLKFNADGTFEDNRRIGGIGGFRKGTYAVKADQVVLTFDGGKNTQTYAISFGTQKDKSGIELQTLLLKGTGLSFLLTKKQ